jgi:tight adherence protein B
MRRRLSVTLACAGTAWLAFAAGAGAADAPGLTPLSSVRFPYRAFVLTTSKPRPLDSTSVVVRENGQPVDGVSVTRAARAATGTFGVVLVIDASKSMRGAPIVGAMKAARVFAAHKAAAAALGLVTFNRTAQTVVAPTTDEKKIAAALASEPTLARSTHIYDALASAIDALKARNVKAGSIVLLSDGHDTGSALSSSQVAAKARNAHVRVFAVGLRSPQYSPGPLRDLSRSTGATYAEAKSAAGVSGIYRARSKQLAREYLLRYRSLAGPAKTVHVQVAAAGIPALGSWSYMTPALPTTEVPPFHRSFAKRFVQSPGSVLIMSILVALLVWYAVRTLFRHRQTNLRERIGDFSSERREEVIKRQVTTPRQWFIDTAVPSATQFLTRYSWWERYEQELEIARFRMGPVPLAILTVLGTIVAIIILGLISPVLALVGFAVPVLVRSLYKSKLKKQRDAFAEQLPGNLNVLAASLRAGHSFVSALSSVVDEAEEPSSSELRRAVSDEQLGVPVEDALLRVAARMDSGDLEQVALVASLQRETGGNTAEVLDAVVDACRERFELRRLVKALTAQGRLSRWILTGLPIVVAFVIALLNPGYLKPLFTTSGGQMMLAVAIVLLVIGSYLIKRMTEIEI